MSKALKKAKKSMAHVNPKPAATERTKMLPLFTDTTCRPQSGSSSWEAMYKLFEDEKSHKVWRTTTADAFDSSEATT